MKCPKCGSDTTLGLNEYYCDAECDKAKTTISATVQYPCQFGNQTLCGTEIYIIGDTTVKDLTPLTELDKLERLYLEGPKIVNLTPLSKLNTLIDLKISYTSVVDLTPLVNLSNIKWLDLEHNQQIVNFRPLIKLNNLKSLYLKGTQITPAQVAALKKQLPNLTIYGL